MHSPLRSLPPPRPGRLPGRVAADCDHPQPAQIVARRPRPGRNGDGGSTGRLTQVARRAARPDSAGRNGATRATATAQDVENPRLRSFVQQPQTQGLSLVSVAVLAAVIVWTVEVAALRRFGSPVS